MITLRRSSSSSDRLTWLVSEARLRRRRWARRGAALAAVAVLASVAGWQLMRSGREGVQLSAAAQAFPWLRAPSEAPVAQAPGRPEALPAEDTLPASAAPAAPVAHELCGLGRIVVAPPAGSGQDREPLAELPAPVGRFALHEAQARMVQALQAGDARQRVAARLLQPPADDDPAAQVPWAKTLLADALASRDPQALRWAGAACPFVEDEAACRLQLVRARVNAEPANALHWLDLAQEEPAAAEAAWAGLQRAQYWREQPLGLAGVAVRALVAAAPDLPGYVQSTLATEAMSRDVAFPAPALTSVLARCPVARPGGHRAGTESSQNTGACGQLARLLVERSDSVQGLMLGRELGEHVGWSAERLQRLDDEVLTLQKQEHHWAVDARQPLGCHTVEGLHHHIAAVEREGELAVLRRNSAAAAVQPPR